MLVKRSVVITILTSLLVIGVVYGAQNLLLHDGARESIKVGFLYEGDASTPYTYNFMTAQEAIEQYYGERIECFEKYNVIEEDAAQSIQELVDSGCDLIFATSYGFGETVKEYAKQYPNIEFCQTTCENANQEPKYDNYHNYMGTVYQGRYISGVVAGMKLKELISEGKITPQQAKIGYVGAYPYAEVISGYTAFFLGARSVVPEATMQVMYTNSWNNYTVEKKYAQKLIKEGCVIISQHSDTTGPAVACEQLASKYTVYHVGYNQSMTDVAPTTSLISCRINWKDYESAAIGAVLNNQLIEDCVDANTYGNDAWAGFDKNWVQILDLNEIIAAKGTQEKIEVITNQFIEGKCHVFYGDYIGVDPFDSNDVVDLNTEYIENDKSSAPTFHYVLKDVITIEAEDVQ